MKLHHHVLADRPRTVPTLHEGRPPYTLRIQGWPRARHRRRDCIIWAWLQRRGIEDERNWVEDECNWAKDECNITNMHE
jgi:hypothetical protein